MDCVYNKTTHDLAYFPAKHKAVTCPQFKQMHGMAKLLKNHL